MTEQPADAPAPAEYLAKPCPHCQLTQLRPEKVTENGVTRMTGFTCQNCSGAFWPNVAADPHPDDEDHEYPSTVLVLLLGGPHHAWHVNAPARVLPPDTIFVLIDYEIVRVRSGPNPPPDLRGWHVYSRVSPSKLTQSYRHLGPAENPVSYH